MAVQTITYDNKQFLNQNSTIADVNKVNDSDMNEIKTVVNNNASELTDIVNAEAYSTTAIKTNKVWIDGKPIYRVVMSFTNGIGTSGLTLPHNISNLSFYRITEFTMLSDSGLSYNFPLVGYNNTLTDKAYCWMDSTNIYIYASSSWGTIWTKYATIEYTLTTD